MKEIDTNVRRTVLQLVEEEQSFNSLDIYCLLGIRVNNEEHPIYNQLWDMYKNREMPSYLSEWVTIQLECGSYAKVWRYYKPRAEKKSFPIRKWSDDRIEIPREALGHFPLLDEDMAIKIGHEVLTLKIAEGDEIHIVDTTERVKIPAKIVREANLHTFENLQADVFANRIEIIGK